MKGAVTRLENVLPDGVYRLWCGTHEMDLAVQAAFEKNVKEPFQDSLYSLISFPRRQTNLKIKIGTL